MLQHHWARKPITLSDEDGEKNIVIRVYSCVLNPVRSHEAQDDEQGLWETETDEEGIDSNGSNGNVSGMDED
ncbi:hypothetical protein B0F90DRAFT_1737347 [Multifurca ochricompacta]|uniref:Uncharacterized protein n=1 Tax=Multifurca ochricompacta TaxID=376703 RepID=A0AAD4QJC2_9AGAM|nr:hypothetical protein B0F90DRAFT_1737347 [Multifurca ochricompacta]